MKVFSENKKAYFNYEILERIEAGIALIGQEVKSIRSGRINLAGSYVVLKQSAAGRIPEVFLIGANIPPYQPKNAPKDYNPERSRKLLLRKAEIKHLIGKVKERGLTLVPLKVYTEKAKIKIEFGLGKGKRKFDKRESIKKRELNKEIERELKTRG
ncbi:MAG: SsrA-binding protein [Candidatus Nealsonbacteria bacterium RBG_13_42_11]|uniref:SsrA-binding protein n=1 Tax=Candidatus Nealsonbacteria bacterium RBG_13_42_11 TaxID=1801663 RepID=A0A1G2E1J5_9BACT|nr:MAG: SsrA-binding protein [Candidatus Nealsonbacteria bacterium RBG_13_42_11]